MTINELKHEVTGRLFALIGVERLEHFHYNFDLGFRRNRENIAVEMHRAALVFGVREHLAHGPFMPPSAAPKTSRKQSSFTAIATRIATFSYSPPQLRLR